jgi:hypothetical protein
MQDQKRFHAKHETPKSGLSRREKISFKARLQAMVKPDLLLGQFVSPWVSQPAKMPRRRNLIFFYLTNNGLIRSPVTRAKSSFLLVADHVSSLAILNHFDLTRAPTHEKWVGRDSNPEPTP